MANSLSSVPVEVTAVIEGRPRDLGGFSVRRLLPSQGLKHLGPFVFFDHMGPAELAAGQGIDVRPHPHIHLATVTYLFEGTILHRDSLGSQQLIVPGEMNWMTAGRGIVHSERTPADVRYATSRLHGIQLWVALPKEDEDVAPAFSHHSAAEFPLVEAAGVQLRVLLGTAYGTASPVSVFSALFYVDALLRAGSTLSPPDGYTERGVYVAEGSIRCGDVSAGVGHMLAFAPHTQPVITAESRSRLVLLGGAALNEPRYIEWNFVSSSPERIERAKQEWKQGRFPKVPGDDVEFIPLPE
jgi:redox-sensitive bicupin YhaK (pirin superfamily)